MYHQVGGWRVKRLNSRNGSTWYSFGRYGVRYTAVAAVRETWTWDEEDTGMLAVDSCFVCNLFTLMPADVDGDVAVRET